MSRNKVATKRRGDPVTKPESLFKDIIKQDQILEGDGSNAAKHTKKRKRADEEEVAEHVVDRKQAKRIFKQARAQLEEETGREANAKKLTQDSETVPETEQKSDYFGISSNETDTDAAHHGSNEARSYDDEVCLDDADRLALDAFFYNEPGDAPSADDDNTSLVLEFGTDAASKLSDLLKEKRTELQSLVGESVGHGAAGVNVEADFETWKNAQSEQVLTLYAKVRDVLSRYRSGKLPKAFKIVPALDDATWRHFIELLEPTRWTARAMFEATRLFASNLNERRAEVFYRAYLLPRVRDDIAEFGKLNSHLFAALRRAVYKPAAFVKGILFTLLALDRRPSPSASQTGVRFDLNQGPMWCTNREAYVFAAVLSRLSVPMLHAAAACVKLTTGFFQAVQHKSEVNEVDDADAFASEFFHHSIGPFSLILRALVEKRYALPFRALAALVDWFVFVHSYALASSKRKREQCTLNVVWYQCVLAFVERYATQLTSEQLAELLALTEAGIPSGGSHKIITPAIRRVVLNALQHAQ